MDNTTNNQIYIQDYIVRAHIDKNNLDADLIGECNDISADELTQSARVYEQISTLINDVSQLHQNEHCLKNVDSSENFTLRKENENLHLVLSSFAVKALNKKT